MATDGWYDIDPDMMRKLNEAHEQWHNNVPPTVPTLYRRDLSDGAILAVFAAQQQANDARVRTPQVVDTETPRLRQELDEARRKIASLERENGSLRRDYASLSASVQAVWLVINEFFPQEEIIRVNNSGMCLGGALRHLLSRTAGAFTEKARREPLAREPTEPKWAAGSWRWGTKGRR